MSQTATTLGPEILQTTDDLVGYAHLIAMRAQLSGALSLDGHASDGEQEEVLHQAKVTADRIESALRTCRPKDILALTECYDIMYRLGNRQMPPRGYIDGQHDRLFRAWKSGDREIEESLVVGMLGNRVRRSVDSLPQEKVKAYKTLYSGWIDTLKAYGYFPGATSYENFQRLSLVMRDRLAPYLGEKDKEWKRRWYDCNKVEDLDALGSRILRSYRRFAGSLFPAVLDNEESRALDRRILAILSTRRDLNPFDREAHGLALRFSDML